MLETASGPILEVPPLMGTFFGFRAMWGGGVCARLTRESRVSAAIERALADGVPPVLYAHPWEFDDAHPPMPGLSHGSSASSTSRAARERKGAGAASSRAIASSRSRRRGPRRMKKRLLRMGREKRRTP